MFNALNKNKIKISYLFTVCLINSRILSYLLIYDLIILIIIVIYVNNKCQ